MPRRHPHVRGCKHGARGCRVWGELTRGGACGLRVRVAGAYSGGGQRASSHLAGAVVERERKPSGTSALRLHRHSQARARRSGSPRCANPQRAHRNMEGARRSAEGESCNAPHHRLWRSLGLNWATAARELGNRLFINLISPSAITRSRGPVTRVTCHGNQDSLRLVPARAVACRS